LRPDGYLLGYDIGSSSVKASLLDIASNTLIASAVSPDAEMGILSLKPGWAEQDPAMWWHQIKAATSRIARTAHVDLRDVKAIGISYQMHGLVLVDKNRAVLRNAIIWCDSRAVDIGSKAFRHIGPAKCLPRLLNSPGNFTASKLKWVKENEKGVYRAIDKMMLPGDYAAMMMTGRIVTTPSGLSEGILWDYRTSAAADIVLDEYGISKRLLPDLVPTFSVQGGLTSRAASELGLKVGTPVSYRAGDQPNNAFSLNVLNPGEVATTAGTSGVVYAVLDKPLYDRQSRVNTFVHVNHTAAKPRYGMLLCLNGTGILYSWVRRILSAGTGRLIDYEEMNRRAAIVPVGSDGLVILPFGNGAERTLGNQDPGARIANLRFSMHGDAHLLRAAQEGIVFALNHGFSIMRETGVRLRTVRAGRANMFLSDLFTEAFAATTGTTVELVNTDGSQGAARGAGLGCGIYKNNGEAFAGLKAIKTVEPSRSLSRAYREAYAQWCGELKRTIN
jgi:xylulokinase